MSGDLTYFFFCLNIYFTKQVSKAQLWVKLFSVPWMIFKYVILGFTQNLCYWECVQCIHTLPLFKGCCLDASVTCKRSGPVKYLMVPWWSKTLWITAMIVASAQTSIYCREKLPLHLTFITLFCHYCCLILLLHSLTTHNTSSTLFDLDTRYS